MHIKNIESKTFVVSWGILSQHSHHQK